MNLSSSTWVLISHADRGFTVSVTIHYVDRVTTIFYDVVVIEVYRHNVRPCTIARSI